MDDWQPPQEFDEYRLVRPLGEGAMGRVYLAHDRLLDRAVAVKFIAGAEPSAEWRERMLVEARAVARLQHPNVLGIYRAGSVGGRPYLVSEYLRGTSLKELSRPLPPGRVRDIGLALARGLAAAHRAGVLHRDIKPSNAMLTDEGTVKLLDFGLAKLSGGPAEPTAPAAPPGSSAEPAALGPEDTVSSPARPLAPSAPLAGGASLTTAGAVLGSPLYMSPEAWRGEPGTVASDLYSLGVVLYELATGKAPLHDVPLAQLSRACQETDVAAPALEDARLARAIARCLRRDPAQRFASADALREELELPATGGAGPGGNPWRGLLPFGPEHQSLFFGRDREARALAERLHGERLVVVAGDSGTGKSSLCRAGVLPLLSSERPAWGVTAMFPGRQPVLALGAALAPHVDEGEAWLAEALAADPLSVARALRKRRGPGPLVLFVDQLEELLTQAAPASAEAFVRALTALALDSPALRVLAAVRGDFLTRVGALPFPAEAFARSLYLLRPLGPEGLREAVVGPARVGGVSFESEATLDALVQGARGPGGLPLLQFALSELWQLRDVARGLIPRAALESLGGVEGCLARHADEVFDRLPPAQSAHARRQLLVLLTEEGAASPRTARELNAEGGDARAALEALVRGRLVLAREGEAQDSAYQLAHETLLRNWPRLRGWLAADAQDRAVHERLGRAARDWARLARPRELLWSGPQLQEASRLPPEPLAPDERDFLAASAAAARRRRWTRVAAALLAPLLLGTAALPWLKARYDDDAARALYRQLARSARREAASRAHEAEASRARAFALFDADDEEAEVRWSEALAATARAESAWSQAKEAFDRAIDADPALRAEANASLAEQIAFEERLAPDRPATALRQLLLRSDPGGESLAALDAPVPVALRTEPPGALASLVRYEEDGDKAVEVQTPLSPALPPGSYRATFALAGRAPAALPFLVHPGVPLSLTVPLVPEASVPPGFVYVPPGRFLTGSSRDEGMRRFFFGAQPLHEVESHAYLIARHEVTFAEWIRFLRALPEEERRRRTPSAAAFNGIALVESPPGRYRLSLRPSDQAYRAEEGEPIRYGERAVRAEQDWLRFPVSAVSFDDARAYARWLDATGQVPRARLCDDREWERAGRGADGRTFPAGEALEPDDADLDVTYGRRPGGFGPDEVGSHPASRSPFGADDLSGNVWEWTTSVGLHPKPTLRGGCWYMGQLSAVLANRQDAPAEHKDPLLGVRLCADLPGRP